MQTDSKIKNVAIQTDIDFNKIQNTNELLGKNWLSDQTLFEYFNILNNTILDKKSCLIFNPTVSHAIKSVDDFSHYIDPLQINGKELFIIPINDSEQLYRIGYQGSHWSTLIFKTNENRFYHYDSSNGHNIQSAKIVAKKLLKYITGQTCKPLFVQIKGPQQRNTYDCGTYSIFAVETIVSQVINVSDIRDVYVEEIENLNPSETDLIVKRATLAYLLNNKLSTNAKQLSELMLKRLPILANFVDRKKQPCNDDKESKRETVSSKNENHCRKNNDSVVKYMPNSEEKLLHSSYNDYSCLVLEFSPIDTDQSVQKECNLTQVLMQLKRKPRLFMTADSHGRHCSEFLKELLPKQFIVSSIVKPNAKLHQVTQGLDALTSDFSEEDYVIIVGGTNDIHAMVTLKNFDKYFSFLENLTRKTNVVFFNIFIRFDKPKLNPIIEDLNNHFNKKILQLTTQTENLIPVNKFKLERSDYTQHGLHLNLKGKRKLCQALSDTIKKDYLKKHNSPKLGN